MNRASAMQQRPKVCTRETSSTARDSSDDDPVRRSPRKNRSFKKIGTWLSNRKIARTGSRHLDEGVSTLPPKKVQDTQLAPYCPVAAKWLNTKNLNEMSNSNADPSYNMDDFEADMLEVMKDLARAKEGDILGVKPEVQAAI